MRGLDRAAAADGAKRAEHDRPGHVTNRQLAELGKDVALEGADDQRMIARLQSTGLA